MSNFRKRKSDGQSFPIQQKKKSTIQTNPDDRSKGVRIGKGYRVPNVGELKKISDLEGRDDLTLLTDSQDVDFVKEHIGKSAGDYDGFFVSEKDGEFNEVWGFEGSVPDLRKTVERLV